MVCMSDFGDESSLLVKKDVALKFDIQISDITTRIEILGCGDNDTSQGHLSGTRI